MAGLAIASWGEAGDPSPAPPGDTAAWVGTRGEQWQDNPALPSTRYNLQGLSPAFSPRNSTLGCAGEPGGGTGRESAPCAALSDIQGWILSVLAQRQGGHSSMRVRIVSLGFGLQICENAICLPALGCWL